jgi:broad specificity phosphatase PhoE/ribosomal protein S18 acetylase RimI-like enzyme
VVVQIVYETHATTVDNENGVATGWLPGELSTAGRANAEDLGRRRRYDGLDLVVTSDLARAVQTVEIAFAGADVPIITDPRLRELDYGDLNGAPVDTVHRNRRDRVDTPFPGGQSYRQATDAMSALLDDLLRERDGQRVLLVGHAATRFALDNLPTGRPLEAAVTRPFAWREGWTYELTDVRPAVQRRDGSQAYAAAVELTDVYRAAFAAPGYDEPEVAVEHFRDEQLITHTRRNGFRCVTVRFGERLAGFGYGYTGELGQWWTDRVAERAPQPVVDEWLGGHFEFVELAVDPRWQGRGLACALHDALLLDLPQQRALLTTYRDDRPAPRLYRRLGWSVLCEGVFDDSDLWGLVLHDGQ